MRLGAVLSIPAILILFAPTCRAAESDVYIARCVICHQLNAEGVPGMYPPLANSIGADLKLKQGRRYLIQVALSGMTGPVDVDGIVYNGLMPPFAQLPDAEIADVLNYVLTKFNADKLPKDFTPIAAEEVKQARATPDSSTELPRLRESLMNELKKAHPVDGAAP
ncbi:MAG: cytochrome c [Candidatus Binatus sp.]|uniref:c-type cytochrome n=1 Tax=Candidatus Binatus sp. TaxID=2811406 RepID=UPI00271C958A|nr:cytochrome c [Candidatus Binatus sp.]MDO8432228.1 cytochrome c [Candidatus Binatus sp.]